MEIVEIGTVKERLTALIAHFAAGNANAFARQASIQSGVIGDMMGHRNNKPRFDTLQRLLTAFPSVNPTWLLFGREKMLHEPAASEEAAVEPKDGQEHPLAGNHMSVEWRFCPERHPGPEGPWWNKFTQESAAPTLGEMIAGLFGNQPFRPLIRAVAVIRLSGQHSYVVDTRAVEELPPFSFEVDEAMLREHGWKQLDPDCRPVPEDPKELPW